MGCFVLQNKNKQTVRTFLWESPTMTLVYRNDHGRVEAVANTKELEKNDVSYSVLLTTTPAEIQKKDIAIGSFGYLSYQNEPKVFSPSFNLKEQEDELKKSLQLSSIIHIGVIAILMLISFVAHRFFTKEKQEPVVITLKMAPKMEEYLPPQPKKETVKVSEKKIKEIVKKTEIKKSSVTRKQTPKKITVAKKLPIRKNIPMHRQGPNINQLGALGALSSVRNNKTSLNLNGVGTGEGGRGAGGRGYGGYGNGGGGLGEGLNGGASGALPGKGLVASSPGSGSQAAGAGGYGSMGHGGGRNAEGGAVSFRGKSGAFMAPLTQEATIESGLDRDQIAAVVQKNMGQIIYCYEMGLQGKPDLKGRLTAQWIINGSGYVSRSAIEHSSVDDSKVEKCVVAKIRTWKFPRPIGGVNVDVSYPFELRRVSQR